MTYKLYGGLSSEESALQKRISLTMFLVFGDVSVGARWLRVSGSLYCKEGGDKDGGECGDVMVLNRLDAW